MGCAALQLYRALRCQLQNADVHKSAVHTLVSVQIPKTERAVIAIKSGKASQNARKAEN